MRWTKLLTKSRFSSCMPPVLLRADISWKVFVMLCEKWNINYAHQDEYWELLRVDFERILNVFVSQL